MKNHIIPDTRNDITKKMRVGGVIINAEKETPNATGNLTEASNNKTSNARTDVTLRHVSVTIFGVEQK